jgi:hypothetical protein
LHQAAIVDGAQLIDQQIGVSTQAIGCSNTKAKRLGVVQEGGGERTIRVEGWTSSNGSDNQDESRLARCCSLLWLKMGEPLLLD